MVENVSQGQSSAGRGSVLNFMFFFLWDPCFLSSELSVFSVSPEAPKATQQRQSPFHVHCASPGAWGALRGSHRLLPGAASEGWVGVLPLIQEPLGAV